MNIKTNRVALSLLILFSILSIKPISALRFNFSVETILPDAHPDVEFYKQFQLQFNTDVDDAMTFISLSSAAGIFNKPFLEKVNSLTNDLSSTPFVQKVYSITNTNNIFFLNGNIEARPLIHISNPEQYANDSIYLYQSEYRQLMLSKSGHSLSVAVYTDNRIADKQHDELINSFRQKLESLHFDEYHILNKRQAESNYLQALKRELFFSCLWFLVGIGLLLYLVYRSVLLIFISVLSIIVPNLWTFGVMGWLQIPLNGITLYIPLVVAAAGLFTILTFYQNRTSSNALTHLKDEEPASLFKSLFRTRMLIPLVGVLAYIPLAFSSILSLKLFGVFTAFGLVSSFIFTSIIFHSSPINAVPVKSFKGTWIDFRKSLKYKFAILFIILLITTLSAILISKIQINSNLADELPKNTSPGKAYTFIEREYKGLRPLEISFSLPDTSRSFFDLEILRKIDKIETYLRDSCGAGFLVSPVALYKGTNKAYNGGLNNQFILPDSAQKIKRYFESILQTPFADEMTRHLSGDGKNLRISGKLANLSGKDFNKWQKTFDDFFNRNRFSTEIKYKITGAAVLYDLMHPLFINQISTILLLVFCALGVVAFFRYRNGQMILYFFAFPLLVSLVVLACIQIAGIFVKADTATAFYISFITAVVYAVTFLEKIREQKNVTTTEAINKAYATYTKHMVIFFLCISAATISLFFSNFTGIVHFVFIYCICHFMVLLFQVVLPPALFFNAKSSAKY